MPRTYSDILRAARSSIREVTPAEVDRLRAEQPNIALVDVRETVEWDEGYIPGAVHVPRGHLESQIESAVPDRSRPVVLYCAGGVAVGPRREDARRDGLHRRRLHVGRLPAVEDAGLPLDHAAEADRRAESPLQPPSPDAGSRAEGQAKLLDSKVLLIGAGGLGAPAALYLAAAGVGHDRHRRLRHRRPLNLQRQVIHNMSRIGRKKVDSARETIEALNPDVKVIGHEEMLDASNVERIIAGYDVILDGTDTFETRYILNDAAVSRTSRSSTPACSGSRAS